MIKEKDKRLIDQTIKDVLNDRPERQIKESIALKLGKDITDDKVEEIYKKGRQESGIDTKIYEPPTQNTKVIDSLAKEIVKETIQAIKDGKDAEDEINKAADKLRDKNLSEEEVTRYLMELFKVLELEPQHEENGEEIKLEGGGDIVPLPQLDIDFNESRDIKLKDQFDEDIIPSVDKPLLTEQNRIISQKYEDGEINSKALMEPGNLVIETEKLEDFIRQVKVCALALPPVCSKSTIESYLVNYLSVIEFKFNGIYIFGWEVQRNTDYYKSFDEIEKMNNELEGSLFVIRDIKTFNVLASDILKGIPRNYYLILWNGIFVKSDLVVIENYTGQTNTLWPFMIDMPITYDLETDVSFIYGRHEEYYKNGLSKTYERPLVGMKESWSDQGSFQVNSQTAKVGRERLNVYLEFQSNEYVPNQSKKQLLSGFAGSGINVDSALKRSPKFRNIIISILSNSSSRILLKLPPGNYGMESFLYIFERVTGEVKNGSEKMNIMSKPNIIRREESYEVKRSKIKSLPTSGPCLVITDFILTDQLIPKDIEKFYICGGGEYHDIETVIDLSKAENCLVDRYPRKIQIKNFLTKLTDSVTETIDEREYSIWQGSFMKFKGNTDKLKSMALPLNLREDKLVVNKEPF